ncbi:MAG: hypothetical protein PWR11_711 [Bacillota bacterium]|nr:hypothetical protein [Bacillota bacterium]
MVLAVRSRRQRLHVAFILLFSLLLVTGCAATTPRSLTLAVVGDSQGRTAVWGDVVEAINAEGVDLVVHCGDLTPAGTYDQYLRFKEQVDKLRVPFYAVPGNHDVRGEGRLLFEEFTGSPPYWSFSRDGYLFIGLDDADGELSREQLDWLTAELARPGPKLVFLHIPLWDPRPGEDHALKRTEEAARLHELFWQHQVIAVLSGHVHLFACQEKDGITYVTTGGAGAPLYAPQAAGGFHHWTRVQLSDGRVKKVEAVPVERPTLEPTVTVITPSATRTFTLEELLAFPAVTFKAAFENRFGNRGGEGKYRGVLLTSLLEEAGGFSPGQTLKVVAEDGYNQDFGYENLYPSEEWLKLQGKMLLAYEKDGQLVPEWEEGPRLVLAPADCFYSNADCARTSLPGQGWNVNPSAGARWVRQVKQIEVVRGAAK